MTVPRPEVSAKLSRSFLESRSRIPTPGSKTLDLVTFARPFLAGIQNGTELPFRPVSKSRLLVRGPTELMQISIRMSLLDLKARGRFVVVKGISQPAIALVPGPTSQNEFVANFRLTTCSQSPGPIQP
jgi:hypothetical protein